MARRGSAGSSDEETENAVEDMGLYGQRLAEFRKFQQEKKSSANNSPLKDESF